MILKFQSCDGDIFDTSLDVGLQRLSIFLSISFGLLVLFGDLCKAHQL